MFICEFQFQIGAIKSVAREWSFLCLVQFQFQIGAIKSSIDDNVQTHFTTFQFQIGAIKSLSIVPFYDQLDFVSIPNWCD